MKKQGIILSFIITLILFSSCYTPSPLYGTWADNAGNKITFTQEGTFNAKIIDTEGKTSNVEGNYSVIDNVIIFNISGDTIYTRNTEWDIRGAILYITWTATDKPVNLTLYHIAR